MSGHLKLFLHKQEMGSCANNNCSGHGECFNGTCFCEIQFVGDECRSTNLSYYVVFATIFFLVAFVCLVQLAMSIFADWQRQKNRSLLKACRITTQKLLYFLVFLAALLRGTYFTSPESFDEGWSHGVMSAYYPLLLSGASLIICFWAEVFHLTDESWKQHQFLSKSFLGFIVFNIINYSLLFAELTALSLFSRSPEVKGYYQLIFNCCYAVLLLVTVIFFLIYGVEVFFKVRCGFMMKKSNTEAEEARRLVKNGPLTLKTKSVDISQLQQSRLGLLSQAFFMLAIVLCLCSETLGELWEIKVPVNRRNVITLVFRVVESAVAIWFPCCLWNSMRPEELWILNPERLIKERNFEITDAKDGSQKDGDEGTSLRGGGGEECWICYDSSRTEKLIQPCLCRGDVRTVHHGCLLHWLMEKPGRKDCRVCGTQYRILKNSRFVSPGKVASAMDWRVTTLLVTLMTTSLVAACVTARLAMSTLVRSTAVGTALLLFYVSVKILCQKQLEAYQKAKISNLKIENHVPTISEVTQPTSCNSEVALL